MPTNRFTKTSKANGTKTLCSWYEVKKVLKKEYNNPQSIIKALADRDIMGFETDFYSYKRAINIINKKE